MENNILINIPHSSPFLPDEFLGRVLITSDELKDELELLTDKYTDDLFDFQNCSIVKANFSRLFCDVERFRDDSKERMSKIGMGAIYTNTSLGNTLISYGDEYKNNVLKEYYDSYHERLENTAKDILQRHNRCIIIDAHSFSVELVKRLGLEYEDSPDICIGFEKEFCDDVILEKIKSTFESKGLIVKYNYPYSGSIVPNSYYAKKDTRIKSFMIEVNKSVYLDKYNNKNEQYYKIKSVIAEVIESIIKHEKITTKL